MKNRLKPFIVLFSVCFVLLSFSNCGGTQNTSNDKPLVKNPPFKITEAYYQNWIAGVEEGGTGTNVYIVLKGLNPEVLIKDIYFRNHKLEAKNTAASPTTYVGYLRNTAQRDVVMDSNPLNEAQNTFSNSFPFSLQKNEAVISYEEKGAVKYYKISNLSERDVIPYPQANPNSHE